MDEVLRFGNFSVDFVERRLFHAGTDVALTEKEFCTLAALCRSRERPLSKDELIRAVWSNEAASDAAVTQTVYRLRCAFRRFEPDAHYVTTIPGHGYQLRGLRARGEVSSENSISELCSCAHFELERRTYQSVKRSIELFDRVLNLEPNHVPALMGLAQAHVQASLILSMISARPLAARNQQVTSEVPESFPA